MRPAGPRVAGGGIPRPIDCAFQILRARRVTHCLRNTGACKRPVLYPRDHWRLRAAGLFSH
eukprot:1256466-Pyramimonas_sp.AAC.1